MPLSDGAWGACQVTAVKGSDIVAVALAWHSAEPPTLADLVGVGPLLASHHSWDPRPEHHGILPDDPVPPDFVWLGNLPVPADLTGTPNSFAGWRSLGTQVVLQHWWDHDVPDPVKSAYKSAATRGQVTVDFGAGPVDLAAATARLDLTGGMPPVPATGPVRWAAFDQLPRCTEVVWSGPDRGLVAALAERPLISSLTWFDPPATLDLGGTSLRSLNLRGHIRDLRLPRSLSQLLLSQSDNETTVTVADNGRWLSLHLEVDDPRPTIPVGLEQVRTLTVTGNGMLSAAPARAFRQLQALSLRWQAAPGSLLDAEALADLEQLAVLELHDGYGIDPDILPELPSLQHLDVYGLRRSAVPPLRARYRDIRLVVGGAKSDTWLAANLDNPLRDWVDDDERGGRAACQAYAEAVRAIDKLPPTHDVDAARPILQTMVEKLNAVQARYGIIDTLRREEAADAFLRLAARAGVPGDVADEWFDDWRAF